MNKIYFAGSIRGGRKNVDNNIEVINFLKEKYIVLTEHVGDKNLSNRGESDTPSEYIYNRDCKWIEASDFVIADITTPSLEVGYEIGYAEGLKKPILCICKNDNKSISAMISGNKNLKLYIYNDIKDTSKIIDDFVNSFIK
jgi:nucleoside 2-deoxyribosyltransferase